MSSNNPKTCKNCFNSIPLVVFDYSINNYNVPLCRTCQNWFRDILDYSSATDESITLYFALRERNVPAILEKNDGFKTIDIAIPDAKVNLEIDGGHHNYNPTQALRDLDRTIYSFKKGYYTLRIPNSMIRYDLKLATDKIVEFLNSSLLKKNYKKY